MNSSPDSNCAGSKETNKTGRTPYLFASLLTFGLIIWLILLSVFLFPGEVGTGPLQISMTLATLLAVGVAYLYGFHGALINEAITHSINAALGTIFILLAIGAVIGSLYLAANPDRRKIYQRVGKRWSYSPGEPWGDVQSHSSLVFISPAGLLDRSTLETCL